MILNDAMLIEWANLGGITPFDIANVNPASIDLTWSGRYRLDDFDGWGEVTERDELKLWRKDFVLLDTVETVTIPSYLSGSLYLKSSLGRQGLEHLHAGLFDPGFHGTATLEVIHCSAKPIVLKRGQRIVQLQLMQMAALPMRDYRVTGRYNGQDVPTGAK